MASTRDLRLDTIRGVMLLIMAINHLPWAKTPITGEPFGFVSAAEGFVFLSGLVCAMAYGRSFLQKASAIGHGADQAREKHKAFSRRDKAKRLAGNGRFCPWQMVNRHDQQHYPAYGVQS